MGRKTSARGKQSRGRPVEFDREAAVRAAMNRFWKRGFGSVPASDLADSMAITRSSLYNSFGDRESVFREALETYRRLAPDAALAGIAPGVRVRPTVRKVFREICRVRAADPEARGCLLINAIGELVGVHKTLGKAVAEAVRDSVRVYERVLKQAADQGEIERPRDLRAATRAFVAFVAGLNAVSKVIRDEDALWRLCDSFLDRYGLGAERIGQRR